MSNFDFLSEPPPPYAADPKNPDVPPSYNIAAAHAALDQLTPKEREKFAAGFASAASAPDLQPALENSAELAARACQNIEALLVSLTATLTTIDEQYMVPAMRASRQSSRESRRCVKTFCSTIAQLSTADCSL